MTVSAGPGSRLPGWGQWRRHAGGSRADAAPASRSAATPGARAAVTAAPRAAPLGLAAVCWVAPARQMHGLDRGVASPAGSCRVFAGAWVAMMARLVAVGVMSITWMTVIAVLATAQKLLPANAALDVPLALAITGLGILIVMAPSAVPGLMLPM